jgi:hypothetical protein
MNRILSILAFFRHGRAERTLFRRKSLTLISASVSNPIEERDCEIERSRKTLLNFSARNLNVQGALLPKPRTAMLAPRWELVEGADGRKCLRMKWAVADAGKVHCRAC